MSNLYTNLAAVYEAMYQSFINYEEEYTFYSKILVENNCNSMAELGCGSGNLASHFINNQFDYIGVDISEEMLTLAKKNNTTATFVKADMRNFTLLTRQDAVIITGRSISYLITNNDVLETFNAIHKNLKPSGFICFDCIDANKFIPQIDATIKIVHKANFENKLYQRESFWKTNFLNGFCVDWASVYYENTAQKNLIKIGEDNTTIRTFTKGEILLFLTLSGFEIKEIIERSSYAFDTFVILAHKK